MVVTKNSSEETPLLKTKTVSQKNSKHKEKRGTLSCVTFCILLTELCERLTYYSINGNLVLFFTNVLLLSSPTAITITQVFTGTCYFVPLIGGWIADSIAGRFNTIYGSTLIYFVGTCLLPAAAFHYSYFLGNFYEMSLTARRVYFITGIFIVAIGTGGIKSNVGPFGAQQSQQSGPKAVQSFFNWFYWFIQIGAGIAYSLSAYIQQDIGFDVGYIIPAAAIFCALIVFSSARNYYVTSPPAGSVLTKVFKIVKESVHNKRKSSLKLDSYLDFAKEDNGGNYSESDVDGVKAVWRTIPVFLCLIIFWTIYNQTNSTFFLQGERMNLKLGGILLPAASLNLFNCLICMVLIPVMDKGIYPLLSHFGINPTLLQRMGFGMIVCGCAGVAAGVLEIIRKQDIAANGGIEQIVGGVAYNASQISVLWQIPQFCFIGTGEIFSVIASYEFAYSEAPLQYQGMVMGINMLTNGLGGYVGSLLVIITNAASGSTPWIPNEINNGYIENFFFLLAILMLLNFFAFLIIARRYKYSNTFDSSHSQILEEEVNYKRKISDYEGLSPAPHIS